MAKVHVVFSIKSEESSTSFETKGILHDNTLRFYDDKVKHHIAFNEDSIRYLKTSDVALDFLFEKGKTHQGTYAYAGRTMVLDVKTAQLIHEMHHIELVYDVLSDNTVINHVQLTIDYVPMEEV